MKTIKLAVCLLLWFGCNSVFAQETDYDAVPLGSKSDFKAAEKTVIEACNKVLTTAINMEDAGRMKATAFVIKWMSGTPDYQFAIDASIMKTINKNEGLLSVYMASMAKFVLENPADAKDASKIKLSTYNLLLDYVAHENFGVKMTKPLKSLLDARAKGELEKALD